MALKTKITAVLLLITFGILPAFGPLFAAQDAPPPPPPTPQELDQLLAPIALYPDSLVSQITTASTNPQEILDCDNWLSQNSGLTGTALTDAAQQQGFDPAFIALVNFPQVLEMMAQHIDDYAAIGTAFSADQGEVSASIQRLRDQAYRAGTLRSTPQQQVQVQTTSGPPVYVIQPVNPQLVYVPVYDPTVVYVQPVTPVAVPLITFGIGIGIGALLVTSEPWGWGGWGWNWGEHRAYYNHAYWGGWARPYHPVQIWYHPRPIVWANRPGYNGNWHYRPAGYQAPRPMGHPNYRQAGATGRPVVQPGRAEQMNHPGAFPNRPESVGAGHEMTPNHTRPTPTETTNHPGNSTHFGQSNGTNRTETQSHSTPPPKPETHTHTQEHNKPAESGSTREHEHEHNHQ